MNNSNFNSKQYWEERYSQGGNSGSGSYGILAEFKAQILNQFIVENNVKSVIEMGCGDGNQLGLLKVGKYVGLDISNKALEICKSKYPTKKYSFSNVDDYLKKGAKPCDLAISLDVIFHLIEDDVYNKYMQDLVGLDSKFLIIYACNFEDNGQFGVHVKPRKFTDHPILNEKYIQMGFVKNKYPSTNHKKGSFSDFYIYHKI